MYNFDEKIAGSIDIAQTKAISEKHSELTPYHLLFGLLKNPSAKLSKTLKNHTEKITELLEKTPKLSGSVDPTQLKPNPTLITWLSGANAEATQAGRSEISETDLVGSAPKDIIPFVSGLSFSGDPGEEEMPDFLINLNELARNGKLDPVIGRETEIRSTLEILGRRSKNNPVLVGEAGVGKTAVVEGLAGLIESGDVPENMAGQQVFSLNLGSLMAGTKYRGEFEKRIESLLSFMKSLSGKAILFIDEIHMIIGAGKTDGAMDAANLLKPALARGELKCIGATTQDEYQKYILADSALDRRFRPVTINEPSEEDSIEILLGLKDKFEAHHGVSISNDAIYNAVFWSKQYVQHKNLPDKAIDLIDEAASAKKFGIEAMPAELVTMEADLRAKQTLAKTEKASESLTSEIEALSEKLELQKNAWKEEVANLKNLSMLKSTLDSLRFEQERAEKEGDFERASKIKYSQIPTIEEQLAATNIKLDLTKEDVAGVLARQSGIPKEKILSSKQEKILKLEGYLKSHVYGQDTALEEIADTLVAAHVGLGDATRPMASFLLQGPSGVGKTETAKALSRFFFDTDDQIIRIDLSEYSEKHSVAKLIGAPAGYVGYDDGGVLTEAVRRKPYAIILFDEIEKAHDDFADILLQVLDDGRLTDNKGRTVSFRNTMILLTTNSKNIEADFKPEVLGRLDGKLEYKHLSRDIMNELIASETSALNLKLKPQNIELQLDDASKEFIAAGGFDEKYGARPLKTFFHRTVVRPLSKMILKQNINTDNSEKVVKIGGRFDPELKTVQFEIVE